MATPGEKLCHFGDRCTKGSACPFVHLNTIQSNRDGIVQRLSRPDSSRSRHQSSDRSSAGIRPPNSTSHRDYKPRGTSMIRGTPPRTVVLPKAMVPCRFGADCRNQPHCEFKHTPSNTERTSSSMVEKHLQDIQDEDQVVLFRSVGSYTNRSHRFRTVSRQCLTNIKNAWKNSRSNCTTTRLSWKVRFWRIY